MSKRTERVKAAKARPAEVTEALRRNERAKPARDVVFNRKPAKMIGNKVIMNNFGG